MHPRASLIQVVLAASGTLLCVGASALVVAFILYAFRDAFRDGATLSGLNPAGGGPGFLLLLPPAFAGLLGFWFVGRQFDVSFEGSVLTAFVAGAIVAGIAWTVALLLLPQGYPSIHVLMTSAGLACTVPWVVSAAVRPVLAAEAVAARAPSPRP